MSKLDDILSETSQSIAVGLTTDKWEKVNTKQQIKDLILELVGDDEDIGFKMPADSPYEVRRGINNRLAKLRKAINEL